MNACSDHCSIAWAHEYLSPSSALLENRFDCCVFISLECIYKNDTGAQLIKHFDSSSRGVSRNIFLAITDRWMVWYADNAAQIMLGVFTMDIEMR